MVWYSFAFQGVEESLQHHRALLEARVEGKAYFVGLNVWGLGHNVWGLGHRSLESTWVWGLGHRSLESTWVKQARTAEQGRECIGRYVGVERRVWGSTTWAVVWPTPLADLLSKASVVSKG